jgi:hypothetical protein
MAAAPGKDEVFEVDCPHCRRHFRGKLLAGGSAPNAGFKCPHCKLFVAYERADGSSQAST